MFRRLFGAAFALALLLAPAAAQVGQLPAGNVWGNPSAAQAVAVPSTLTALFDRVFCTTNGQFITRTAGVWTCGAGGGGGTPGGASLTVQYNNASAFGGMSGTSWDDTNRALTMTGATVTTSNPILNLSQTWNAGGVSFKGLTHNIVNTASAAGAHPFEFQIGGNPYFYAASTDGAVRVNALTGAISSFAFEVQAAGSPVFQVLNSSPGKVVITNSSGNGIDFGNANGTINFGGAATLAGTGNGHIKFTSGTPTANSCAGFALSTGSSDIAGRVTFTSATSCSITFGATYTNAPFCTVTPGSAASTVFITTSTTGLAATFGTANTAMFYQCFGA